MFVALEFAILGIQGYSLVSLRFGTWKKGQSQYHPVEVPEDEQICHRGDSLPFAF